MINMVYCSINEKMAEKINDEIEKIIEEDFKGDITTDLETYDENTITLTFSVEGGYERDIKAYWGGEEYMDELIIAIKEIFQVKDANYTLDHEDLTGEITIEYVDTQSIPFLLVPKDNRFPIRRCSIHHGQNQNGLVNSFGYQCWKSQPVTDNPFYTLSSEDTWAYNAYERILNEFKERSGIIKKLVLENRFQGVTTVGEDVFKEFKLVVNLRL